VEHHPELQIADTLMLNDTIKFPEVTVDTAIPLFRLTDTTAIQKDRLEISLIRIRDTIYVKGKCKADTIIRQLRIPIERIKLVKAEPKRDLFIKLVWIILALAGIIIIIKLLRS
jgi:hypothetical protein